MKYYIKITMPKIKLREKMVGKIFVFQLLVFGSLNDLSYLTQRAINRFIKDVLTIQEARTF